MPIPESAGPSRWVWRVPAQWNAVISVNLTGQFLCARAAVREFVRRGVVDGVSVAAGKLIHMSWVHEVIPWTGHANHAAAPSTPEAYEGLMKRVRHSASAIPGDIAQTAVGLASDAAGYVTGASLFVDGGMTRYSGFEGRS